jgi:hypothetical protein
MESSGERHVRKQIRATKSRCCVERQRKHLIFQRVEEAPIASLIQLFLFAAEGCYAQRMGETKGMRI